MLLSLPIVYQPFTNQPHPFYYIGHIVAVATNYSNLLYQRYTNHYLSDPVLYITSLPMITNKLPIHHYQSCIGNLLPIGGQCYTSHQLTNGIQKCTNNCQWFTIGSYWQWYTGIWQGKILWPLEPFSNLKTTLCKYWILIEIKISMACVVEDLKILLVYDMKVV